MTVRHLGHVYEVHTEADILRLVKLLAQRTK